MEIMYVCIIAILFIYVTFVDQDNGASGWNVPSLGSSSDRESMGDSDGESSEVCEEQIFHDVLHFRYV